MNQARTPRDLKLKLGIRTTEGSLDPIPRALGRRELEPLAPMEGFDGWNAYEGSFLLPSGKPQVVHLQVSYDANTPSMVESKSFKLYLNALNDRCFPDRAAFCATITEDLAHVCGGQVEVRSFAPEQSPRPAPLPGETVDKLSLEAASFDSTKPVLRALPAEGPFCFHSHLLRSLCPVTRQPDWGSVLFRGEGPRSPDPAALLAMVVALRNQEGFHETCCEKLFTYLYRALDPQRLEVSCYYTRRGGLDINPVRVLGYQPHWRAPVWRQ